MKVLRASDSNNLRTYSSSSLIKDAMEELMQKGLKTDPKYTRKKLAEELGMHRTTFFNLLAGRRSLSKKLVLKHFTGKISGLRIKKILTEIDWEKQNDPVHPGVKHPKSIEVFNRRKDGIPYLTKDQHDYTSDPYMFAISLLFETEGFVPSTKSIARKLSLTEKEVLDRIKRLKRLGFLEKTKTFYKPTGAKPVFIHPKYNKATKTHILKLGNLASKRVREEAFDGKKRSKSYFEYWYFTVDPEDFDEFTVEIQNLVKRFRSKHFKSKPKKIYSFNIGFLPVEED